MRRGIHCSGNFIIDHVKKINKWPKQGMLATISQEVIGTGGGPFNVVVDLAKMDNSLPLFASGVIGKDKEGDIILNILQENHINCSFMQRTSDQPTSYTDVMSEEVNGCRTFFHCRGANALLDYDHFVSIQSSAKIFHLGYLLLLDKLDNEDKEFGIVAARVLHQLQDKGFKTSVDLVSEESDRYKKIVLPCLKYINYLVVNEIEASGCTGLQIRDDNNRIHSPHVVRAAEQLLAGGVQELVVIHFPEGAFALSTSGARLFMPSYIVKEDEVQSTVGAGDAFCAGLLYGLHEEWPLEKSLKFAHASARFTLTNPTCTGGAVPVGELQRYMEEAKLGQAVVEL